jgi:hypothetical protein
MSSTDNSSITNDNNHAMDNFFQYIDNLKHGSRNEPAAVAEYERRLRRWMVSQPTIFVKWFGDEGSPELGRAEAAKRLGQLEAEYADCLQ